jgi:RNA polymerase sigma-70 factor (ECF subfamily)
VPDGAAHAAIEAVWRRESTRLVAGLLRRTGDLDRAEDLAQDALVQALSRWPTSGVPANPGAWLMAVAGNRSIDQHRSGVRRDRVHGELSHAARTVARVDVDRSPVEDEAAVDDRVDDDVLGLMFLCCHPVLPDDARVALSLRLLGGLTTEEIGRAHLTSEATIAQRITRAKRTLAEHRATFEHPDGPERARRLTSLLRVIYLVFNEGYAATVGDDLLRPALCDEALRLGRMLQALVPDDPEVHGLAALLEIQASRAAARTGPDGELVVLADQDRRRWDRLLIRRGLAALDRAAAMRTAGPSTAAGAGQYELQARIAAGHARAASFAETDWAAIAAAYSALAVVVPSPVVELNRAVAVGYADGPAAGLALVDALAAIPSFRSYHLLPSIRGDLLERLGRHDEARAAFERAASLTGNDAERRLLLRRAAQALDGRATVGQGPAGSPGRPGGGPRG